MSTLVGIPKLRNQSDIHPTLHFVASTLQWASLPRGICSRVICVILDEVPSRGHSFAHSLLGQGVWSEFGVDFTGCGAEFGLDSVLVFTGLARQKSTAQLRRMCHRRSGSIQAMLPSWMVEDGWRSNFKRDQFCGAIWPNPANKLRSVAGAMVSRCFMMFLVWQFANALQLRRPYYEQHFPG